MAETAAHLVERVIPRVPVRQWVLTFPFPIRFLLAYDPALCALVRRVFMRAVLGFLERGGRKAGLDSPKGGAVVHAQRFGSALNLNLHFHALILDGVFVDDGGRPVFHEAAPLSDEEVAQLTALVRERVLRHLRRKGHVFDPAEAGEVWDREPPEEPLLAELAAASIEGRGVLEGRSGPAVERLGAGPVAAPFMPGSLCAGDRGFSLQARVRVDADERDRLERLCSYVAPPPIASERLSLDDDGRVRLELRRPFRDGTTHVSFDPLTFIERLAALVPRPRVHQFTYHGVLAPAAAWRSAIVPVAPEREGGESCAHGDASDPVDPDERERASRWARLMKRVFDVDVLVCDHCGGPRRIIAFVTERRVVQRILGHLGLPTEPPAIRPARPPPGAERLFE